jgi:hypothetical protein
MKYDYIKLRLNELFIETQKTLSNTIFTITDFNSPM